MDFDASFWTAILAGAIRAGTPLLCVALGELIYERAGVLNLGLEGMMLVGALVAVVTQVQTNQWFLAILMAMAAGMIVGLLHGFLCVWLGANQIAVGLAFVILCQGMTSYFGRGFVGRRVDVNLFFEVPILKSIPFAGNVLFRHDLIVYVTIVLVIAVSWFLFRTKWGVMLRAVGESAESASLHGIRVRAVRLGAAAACGALCGLGGAHLSLAYASQWQEGMTAGRGWIALVLVIFSMWRPGILIAAAYFFGGLTALYLNLQAIGVTLSPYLLGMIPFFLSIVVLTIATCLLRARPIGMPSDLGKPLPSQNEGANLM